jgi:ParB family chromosome partitioning protein
MARGFGGLTSLRDMAEKSKVLDKGLGYLLLPIEDVVSKAQVRKRFTGIEELAATIKQDQLQSPIQVAPKDENGKYVILRGERRWRACKLLGMKEIKAIIDDTDYNSASMLIGEIVENVQRNDLDALELAMAIQRLVTEENLKPVEIAERLGKSRGFVSMHLSIANNLPQAAEKLMNEGFLMGAETLYILGQIEKESPDVVQELCERAYAEGRGVTRGEAREAQYALNEPEPAQDESPAVTKPEPSDSAEPDASTAATATDEAPATGEESFAGETFVKPEGGEGPAVTTTENTQPSQSAPVPASKPASRPSPVAIDLMVSVLVDDAFQKGTIAWSRKAPREGYVFVALDDGTVRSFALTEVQLLDVRNVEEGAIS